MKNKFPSPYTEKFNKLQNDLLNAIKDRKVKHFPTVYDLNIQLDYLYRTGKCYTLREKCRRWWFRHIDNGQIFRNPFAK